MSTAFPSQAVVSVFEFVHILVNDETIHLAQCVQQLSLVIELRKNLIDNFSRSEPMICNERSGEQFREKRHGLFDDLRRGLGRVAG